MATVLKVRRIANPRGRKRNGPRRRRNMTAKQIRYFGSKAQKAALRRKRHRNIQGGMMTAHGFVPFRSSVDYDPDRAGDEYGARTDNTGFTRRKKGAKATKAKAKRRTKKGARAKAKATRRKRNPALVVTLGAANPRRKRRTTVARIRRRRRSAANPRRRRRANAYRPRRRRPYARRANPRRRRRNRRSTRVVVIAPRRRNYRRRRNGRRVSRRSYRRRNPSLMGGSITSKRTLSILGGGLAGVAAAKFIPTMLPLSMLGSLATSQIGRVLITGGSAVIAGWAAEKFVGNGNGFADGVMFGGLMQTASVALNTFLPGIWGQLGIGLGDLMPGQFSVPQNPIRAGIPAPAPANARVTMNGLARAYGAAF